ncbi:MAG: hypothetical protein U9Q62_05850 [Campylobacterota bacterium]|nr:hypothetical protein [Campylobacterota bacterium]
MLFDIVKNEAFCNIMRSHIQQLLIYLFEQEQNFGILCKIEQLTFDPELPKPISDEFRPMTLFFLAGYTFESARIDEDTLIFEAGFGTENIGSLVTVPLLSIMQIIIDETPIFVNLASPAALKQNNATNNDGIKNSMAAFLSNPENNQFIKKK